MLWFKHIKRTFNFDCVFQSLVLLSAMPSALCDNLFIRRLFVIYDYTHTPDQMVENLFPNEKNERERRIKKKQNKYKYIAIIKYTDRPRSTNIIFSKNLQNKYGIKCVCVCGKMCCIWIICRLMYFDISTRTDMPEYQKSNIYQPKICYFHFNCIGYFEQKKNFFAVVSASFYWIHIRARMI